MARGFRWSFAGTLVQGVLQIGVTMTMARLLGPADYGLYALVEVILRWATLFGQTGLATVLVQKPELTDDDLRGARTLALGLALGSAAVVIAGAPWIAAAFGKPEVAPLLRVASLAFLFNGLGLTSLAMLRRRMQFGRLSSAEIGGYVLGNALTAIVLASRGAGVWSVVIGSLVGQIVQNLIAIAQARLSFGFSLKRTKLWQLAQQGAHVSFNSCLDVINNTMDTFVVARVMPQTILGLFNRAAMLAMLPTNFIWTAVSRVTFPGFARLQHDPATLAVFFHRTQGWTGPLSVAIPLAMIPASDVIVAFLLGPAWTGAVPILRLVLLAFAFESLAFPYHNALDAIGAYAARTKIRAVLLVVRASCLAGLVWTNRDWVFYAGSLTAIATWLISVGPFVRRLGVASAPFFRHDLTILLKAVLVALAVWGARVALGQTEFPVYVVLLGCMIAGAATLAVILRKKLSVLTRQHEPLAP